MASSATVAELVAAVRAVGRDYVGADGITVILRDDGKCFYADEDAISPLWKGQRFPLEQCASGWVMTHRQAAIIPNIYMDPRVPQDAYRRTFVKSLMIVPVPGDHTGAAIGAYWAEFHDPSDLEQVALYSLARTMSPHMVRLSPTPG